MSDPSEFEWPFPTTLDDDEVEQVVVALRSEAEKARGRVVDRPTHYMAALAAASAEFVAQLLDRRRDGTARGPFDAIEPEDFGGDDGG